MNNKKETYIIYRKKKIKKYNLSKNKTYVNIKCIESKCERRN